MSSIVFSKEAIGNINDIRNYISRDSFQMSEKVVEGILHIIQYLSLFPNLGVKKGKYLHIIEPVYRYTIRYRVEGDIVYIITIYKYQNK